MHVFFFVLFLFITSIVICTISMCRVYVLFFSLSLRLRRITSRFDDVNELQKTIPWTIRFIYRFKEGAEQMPTENSIERPKTKNSLDCNRTMKKSIISAATDAAAVASVALLRSVFPYRTQKREWMNGKSTTKKNHRHIENKNETQLPTNCFALYEVQ